MCCLQDAIFPLTAESSQAIMKRNVVREFPMFGTANALARRSHAPSGEYNDFGTSGLRDFGTSGLRDFGHCYTSDSSSNPPGRLKRLKLSPPGLSVPARRCLTAHSLKHKLLKRKLRPLSVRFLNLKLLNLNPLTLSPLNWPAALAAGCPQWSSPDGTPTPIESAAQRGPYANRG